MNFMLISILNKWMVKSHGFSQFLLHMELMADRCLARRTPEGTNSKTPQQYVEMIDSPLFPNASQCLVPFCWLTPPFFLLHVISFHIFAGAIQYFFLTSVHYILHVCEPICTITPTSLHIVHIFCRIFVKQCHKPPTCWFIKFISSGELT